MRVIDHRQRKDGYIAQRTAAAAHGHEVDRHGRCGPIRDERSKPLDCDAVIDFSHPDNLEWVCDVCQGSGTVCYICGTTGLT